MGSTARAAALIGLGLLAGVIGIGVPVAIAQEPNSPPPPTSSPAVAEAIPQTPEEFITYQVAELARAWDAAMSAVLAGDAAKVEEAFAKVLELKPAPFRVALLEDYTTQRTANGGALLLMEQDKEAGKLGESAAKAWDLLVAGKEQKNQADDGWYFASIGRFDVAKANFEALLAAGPDPVAVLEFADRFKERQALLVQLAGHPVMGPSVQKVLAVLREGERQIKADPLRIQRNVLRLGGGPRAFENGLSLLKDSGEYAIPFMIQTMRNANQRPLLDPLVRALPQIDRPALNPLVVALQMPDSAIKLYVIKALGQIGYPQAVPYLLELMLDEKAPPEVRDACKQALETLVGKGIAVDLGQPPADAYFHLAEQYYADVRELAADPRLDTANIWYWRDDLLQNVEVPTAIFNEVMCLRLCESALRLNPGHKQALALWLAADFRREAQLGEGKDRTRPEGFPAALYFAQSAGPEYCQLALARAVKAGEPAVALGTIEALRATAGPVSLLGDPNKSSPLAEALSFPARLVRIRAALALAMARPEMQFNGYQNLMPVLAETLRVHAGVRDALVVDPDEAVANTIAGALRAEGYQVVTTTTLLYGLQKIRTAAPGIDVIVIGSNIASPGLDDGLHQLRAEFRFAATPVILVTKPADGTKVRDLVRADMRLGQIVPAATGPEMSAEIKRVSTAIKAEPITPELGLAIAKEATEALHLLAVSRNPIFKPAEVEPALLIAFTTKDAELRKAVAQVLGFLPSAQAQEAMVAVAFDTAADEAMRVAMFAALAESAKQQGNLLSEDRVKQLVTFVQKDESVALRTAASQTLGALNLPATPASQIIRDHAGQK